MRILKKILLLLVVLVVLFLAIGFLLPRQFHLERSTTIAARPASVFALLNGYSRYNEWSPWAEADPAALYAFEGPREGVGAKMSWQSEKPEVGSGSQQIVASEPYRRIETALDFGDQGLAEASFELQPEGTGTVVTWGFDSDLGAGPVGRWFGLVLSRFLERDFDKGLAKLKTLAEGLPSADWTDLEVAVTEVAPQTVATTKRTTTQESADISAAHASAYGELTTFLAAHNLTASGPPLTINTAWKDGSYEFEAGLPYTGEAPAELPADSPIALGATYGGLVVQVVHRGAYAGLATTHEKIDAYLAAHGYAPADRSWHVWISDPATTPEAELQTQVLVPVRKGGDQTAGG